MDFLTRLAVIAVCASLCCMAQLSEPVRAAQLAQPNGAEQEKTSYISKLVIKSKPQPSYTTEARERNVEGVVKLKVLFSSSGKVSKAIIIEGLPYGLTEKAVEAAKKIKFEPGMNDGRPISMYAHINYEFAL